jgi:hypothetical protein
VTRRVFVEQGVMEHGVERPDPATPIDERDLAKTGGTIVA